MCDYTYLFIRYNANYRCIIYSNKTIGHIPDGLAQLLSTLVKDGKIKQIYGVITRHARAAPEGNVDTRRRH